MPAHLCAPRASGGHFKVWGRHINPSIYYVPSIGSGNRIVSWTLGVACWGDLSPGEKWGQEYINGHDSFFRGCVIRWRWAVTSSLDRVLVGEEN